MERRDFQTAWDQRQAKTVNAAELSGSDRFGLDIHHQVVLLATIEEASVLRRGLQALRAQAELQSAVGGSVLRTDEFVQLEKVLTTQNNERPLQMPDMPEGFFVTPIK